MLSLLPHRAHAILDYVTVAFFAIAPTALGLNGVEAAIAYVLAIVHLLVTLTTAAPLSLLPIIPNRLHGAIELAVGLTLGIAPWFAGAILSLTGQVFYSVAGGVIFAVWIASDYSSVTEPDTVETEPVH